MIPPVVTISATYGSGGSIIGPRVARSLELPFIDRAIPVEVSNRLAVPLEEALAHDERAMTGIGKLLASFAWAPPAPVGTAPPTTEVPDEREFKEQTERVIREHARGGAVILGRAAALVLAQHPSALHTRLDGSPEARIAQAVRHGALEAEARKQQEDADRARAAYVKAFYQADPADTRLYHLTLDSTVIDLDTCVGLIVMAARARQTE